MKYDKDVLNDIIKNVNSKKELCDVIGIKYGNSAEYLNKKIEEHNLDTSHFIKNITRHRIENKDLFIKNSKVNRSTIRKRLIDKNIIPYICACCGQDENWMGKKMPLILDHINGINNNNELENLRFLCSNCDSIQETYKNKNGIEKRKIQKEQRINNKLQRRNKKIEEKNNIKQDSINKILNSNIDFSKKNWGVIVSKIINKSPQYSLKFVKDNIKLLG